MLKFITFFTIERLFYTFVVSTLLFLVITPLWGFAWSWFFLIISVLILVRYFLLGTIGATARIMQGGDMAAAEKMLNYTYKPQWLQMGMHAMYYFMKASIAMQKQKLNEAEPLFLKSLSLGVPDKDSQSMAYLSLAGIAMRKQNKNLAKEYMAKLKKLKPLNSVIEEQYNMLEKALNAPQMTMQQQMMAQNRGGRFRR
jgi:hypothetical protein